MVPKAKRQKLEMFTKEGDKLFKRILNLEILLAFSKVTKARWLRT